MRWSHCSSLWIWYHMCDWQAKPKSSLSSLIISTLIIEQLFVCQAIIFFLYSSKFICFTFYFRWDFTNPYKPSGIWSTKSDSLKPMASPSYTWDILSIHCWWSVLLRRGQNSFTIITAWGKNEENFLQFSEDNTNLTYVWAPLWNELESNTQQFIHRLLFLPNHQKHIFTHTERIPANIMIAPRNICQTEAST